MARRREFRLSSGKEREKMGAREVGRKTLGFFRTWLLAMGRGLGSQDDSEIKWPGEKLVPFSEKVTPGHGCSTGGRGPFASALGLHLGPAQVCSLLFTFHRQRWEPAQATPVRYSCPGGDSPGGEAVLYFFSIDDAPPKRHECVLPCHSFSGEARFHHLALRCKENP